MQPREPANAAARWASLLQFLPLGGDASTILAGFYPAPAPRALPTASTLEIRVSPCARVRVFAHVGRAHGAMVVIVPGFTSHAGSRAVMRAAAQACAREYSVVRVNLRNGGRTHALCDGLFNLQQWADVGEILQDLVLRFRPSALYALGFSLGGALLLNLLGRRPALSELVRGVVAINPPVDIPRAVACVNLPRNRIYAWLFLRSLIHDVEVKRALGWTYPDPRSPRPRTVPEYDWRFVLPETDFRSLDDYYAASSALPWLNRIRCRTAILSSRDDPLVPPTTIEAACREGCHLNVILLERGGHCAYPERHGLALRSSAVEMALDFFGQSAGADRPASCRPT